MAINSKTNDFNDTLFSLVVEMSTKLISKPVEGSKEIQLVVNLIDTAVLLELSSECSALSEKGRALRNHVERLIATLRSEQRNSRPIYQLSQIRDRFDQSHPNY